MMNNEFGKRYYTCPTAANDLCSCLYPNALEDQSLIEGSAVLRSYGYNDTSGGELVGTLFAIIAAYRGLVWAVLYI